MRVHQHAMNQRAPICGRDPQIIRRPSPFFNSPSPRLHLASSLYRLRSPPRLRLLAATECVDLSDLTTDTADAWRECAAFLTSLGVDAEVTEGVIIKAFGWGSQAYWRQEKVQQVPKLVQVHEVLSFLGELGIEADPEKAALITKFPEVLGLDIQLMRDNVAKLQKAYFLKGNPLKAAIMRKPRVLGSIVDCQGSCEGFCTRCFAQF